MPKSKVTTYVMQYTGRGPEDWIDASSRGTPEEAFDRLDAFRASWDALDHPESHPQDFQVVRRDITDTVIADPRPAPEPEQEKEGAAR